MHTINSDSMPTANGHYSQCIEHNGVLYLSGQLPIDPYTRAVPVEISAQTTLALSNIHSILRAAGNQKEDVIQVRIYLVGIENWDDVNDAYTIFFGDHKPVRCIVPVPALHFGCKVEIEALSSVSINEREL